MNTKCVLIFTLLAASAAAEFESQANSSTRKAGVETVPQVMPNRKLPEVPPPQTTLEFSANPTTHEIFRARIFEEPLVPIGGERNRNRFRHRDVTSADARYPELKLVERV